MMWQCYGLMGFSVLVFAVVSTIWKFLVIYLLPICNVAMFGVYGVQYIGFCNDFLILRFPIYIFKLEIFNNIYIGHI